MKENDDDLNVRDEEDCVTSKHVRSFSVFLPKWIWSRRFVCYMKFICQFYVCYVCFYNL